MAIIFMSVAINSTNVSITPFIWVQQPVKRVVDFYLSIFKDGKVIDKTPIGSGEDSYMSMTLELAKQRLIIFNPPPMPSAPTAPNFTLTPAFSLMLNCDGQNEIDYYWQGLTSGGKAQPCGWLVDQFGLSWQVVPKNLRQLLFHPDPKIAGKIMASMMHMKKIEIAQLAAAAG